MTGGRIGGAVETMLKRQGHKRSAGAAGARWGGSLLLAAWAVAASCQADVIRLKNGNQLEGAIRAETATSYRIELSFGSLDVRKDQVAGVVRATAGEQAQRDAARRTQFILHEKYAPAGQLDLLQELRAVETQRDGALQAERNMAQEQQALVRDSQELAQLQAQEAAAAGRLVALGNPTGAQMQPYNQTVAEVNALRARLRALQQKLPAHQNALEQGRHTTVGYTGALIAFAGRVEKRRTQGAGADEPQSVTNFFDAVEARLKTYLGEIKQVQLPFQTDRQQWVVKARLNDQAEGLFMVDTGATTMCISEEMARRLQLPAGPAETTVTLADGSKRMARLGLLRSVEVEGARVANVAVVTLPVSPGDGLDGLLGMNFMREFNIQLDTVSHRMILNQFTPP